MKNLNWKEICTKDLRHKSEKERFALFYRAIKNDDGNIMFAGNLLQRAAVLFPDHIALIYHDRKISYQELYHRALLFSKKIIDAGVKPHDRVLLFFQNSLAFYIAYFGIWQTGAVVAPLNFFLTERELKHIVDDARPSLIVASSDKLALFDEKTAPPIFTEKEIDPDGVLSTTVPDFASFSLMPDELAALLYTSGTTGLPKGVMLSSKNIMTNVVQTLARMPLNTDQRLFCVLPLFHSFAQNTCVWSAFFAGCTVIVIPKIERRSILEGLNHRPSIFLGVPALYGLLCLLKTAPLMSVDYFISGGDALPSKIRGAFELIYRRKLCNGYGLTETSPLISVDLEDVIEPTNNVGHPVIGIECTIKDEGGHNLPKDQVGLLWVRGDNIMMGYYNEPNKTKEVLQNDWFCTGDLAKFDCNGKLLICGREKDLIIHKGINIYPQEIENVILNHSAVLFVGVIGQADDMNGEVPIAFVQLQQGKMQEGIEKELLALCKKNLAAYKVPRRFVIIQKMPMTATNKVDKKNLRKIDSI